MSAATRPPESTWQRRSQVIHEIGDRCLWGTVEQFGAAWSWRVYWQESGGGFPPVAGGEVATEVEALVRAELCIRETLAATVVTA